MKMIRECFDARMVWRIVTFPDHFHSGDENTILASQLNSVPAEALRQVLEFVRQNLT